MPNYLKLLSPEYRRYLPQLLKWEFLSPVGPINRFSHQRKVRKTIQNKYEALYPKGSVGYYSRYDWMRLELSLPFCVGPKVLEVGPYNGAFIDMLKLWGGFSEITALDIEQHPSWTSPEGAELIICDVTKVELPRGSFNTVSAQEIIEHLPVDLVGTALEKIRNLASDRIIASVPFKEAYPLFKEGQPTGHTQSFDEDKLMQLFPKAFFFEVQAGLGVPWLIIIEDFNSPSPYHEFKASSQSEILSLINNT